jgi:hypothetical protein
MEGDIERARERENDFVSTARTRSRWPFLKGWRLLGDGSEVINRGGFRAAVMPVGNMWTFVVEHEGSGYREVAGEKFADLTTTKLAAFDMIVALRKNPPWQTLL